MRERATLLENLQAYRVEPTAELSMLAPSAIGVGDNAHCEPCVLRGNGDTPCPETLDATRHS